MAQSRELQVAKIRERHERNAASLQLIPNENGNGFTFTSLGFKSGDFNRAGLLNLSTVLNYFQTMRYRIPSAYGLNLTSYDLGLNTFFLLQVRVEISQELFKVPGLTVKMKNINDLCHIGNSTLSFRTILMDETSGLVLAAHYGDYIHVNANTRRAVPFAPDVKQKVGNILSGSPIHPPPKLSLPDTDRKCCYCCKVVVRNIDMDQNNHTAQAAYVDYAFEGAAQAAASAYYRQLRGDICSYGVKNAQFVHMGESVVGDELEVMTWENDLNPFLIYFVITKNYKDVCIAKVEFYDPYVHSNI